MTKLLTVSASITNANNFREAIARTSPDPDTLYMWFGRDSAWVDENNPPAVVADISTEEVTRGNIIGMEKVTITNTAFVVPRYNWVSGTTYDEYSATDDDLFSKEFYVLTSNYQVYKCLDNNSNQPSIIEPTGTSTSPTQTGDGYTWKFMFDLSGSMIQNFLITDWLPVPAGGQKTAFQLSVEAAATYATGTPPGGHGKNAIEELGAFYLMISQTFSGDEGGLFPIADDYRQFGLWKNPRLVSTGNIANGVIYECNNSNSDIDSYSGQLIYIENRRIITRASDQAENIQLILEF